MTERRPLVAGNWKMHHGPGAAVSFLEELLRHDPDPAVDVVLCPPFVALPAAAMILAGSRVGLGAQNVHWESSGAFTGEVSADMLREVGVEWVIVGHSERRALFGETDDSARKRAASAQESGLEVIYCLGETLEQREADDTFEVLARQASVLEGLDPSRLVVAYEPVWAIGTGRNATPEQAEQAHAFLRERLASIFSPDAAAALRVVYGGSLKPANATDLLSRPDVDGGLIGGASLDVASFRAIIHAAADCAAEE